jgi:hypothetical protein
LAEKDFMTLICQQNYMTPIAFLGGGGLGHCIFRLVRNPALRFVAWLLDFWLVVLAKLSP